MAGKPVTQWVIRIPDWTPPSVNLAMGKHWPVGNKIKKEVAELLRVYGQMAGLRFVTDTYRPCRRVAIYAYYPSNQGRKPDPDNLTKITLDAMRQAGVIVDDDRNWLVWERPRICDAALPQSRTVIMVEDCDPADVNALQNPPRYVYTTSRG